MNTVVLVGMAATLSGPLRSFLRARLGSMTLFREALFWRWQREVRKQQRALRVDTRHR
jgi:hypothetical protein